MSKPTQCKASGIEELLEKGIAPRTENKQLQRSKSADLSRSEPVKQIQRSSSLNTTVAQWFNAPSFDLGLDHTFAHLIEKGTKERNVMHAEGQTSAGKQAAAVEVNYEGGQINVQQQATEVKGISPEGQIPAINAATATLDDDDFWATTEIEAACAEAERRSLKPRADKKNENLIINLDTPPTPKPITIDLSTPTKEDGPQTQVDDDSDRTSGSTVPHGPVRRFIKPSPCVMDPFIPNNPKVYTCTKEGQDIYEAVIANAAPRDRFPDADISAHVVNYNSFFVTLKELATSMAPFGWLKNTVVEVGIASLNHNMAPDSKKLVMPLKISTWLQNMDWTSNEVKKKFDRKTMHLDRLDMVMLPVLQQLDIKNPQDAHHYWLFNLNIRDRKFEVLDSMRSLKDKLLDTCVRKIIAALTCIWEDHYSTSQIQIDTFKIHEVEVPKQDNMQVHLHICCITLLFLFLGPNTCVFCGFRWPIFAGTENNNDCGVYMLMNAELWNARQTPQFGPIHIRNIRKLLTYKWIKTSNNIVQCKQVLNLK